MTRTTSRVLIVLALALGALSFAATSSAHDGHHDGHHGDKKQSKHGKNHNHGNTFRYSTSLTSPDSGCDGHIWANDTIKRTYSVKKNNDGSYRLTAFDRGAFTTVAGVSPQGCPTVDNPHHGTAVTAGITGKFGGFLTENITGGTFNPNATCAAVCDRAAFVAAFFGPTAQQNLDKNVKYLYVFMSKDPSLKYHVWLDRGNAGETGGLKTVDRGDIATA
ncbi:MAG: hypothetical protein JWO17_2942 [Actinomycetia bacterium]|jgi:hypothetical protein|nr:hypothetical protein [Actinomycetes bacterium]